MLLWFRLTAGMVCGDAPERGINAAFDKKTLARFQEVMDLEDDKKNILLDLIDTYIRDAKTRKAYLK